MLVLPLVVNLLASTAAAETGFPATSPREQGAPALTVAYEAPIYSEERGENLDNYGARWFEFWPSKYGFAHSPGPAEANNCLTPEIHFCIHMADLLFSAPKVSARPGATWMVDEFYRFRLLSIRTVRFRGRDIKAYVIRGDDKFVKTWRPMIATIYAYNYDVGVIGYTTAWSERYNVSEGDAPVNVSYVVALASQHGIGGRENCKFWQCAPDN